MNPSPSPSAPLDPNPLDEVSLERLLAEMGINRDAAAMEWKSGDMQGYHAAKTRHEAIRCYILDNFRHRKGESLAEIRGSAPQAVGAGPVDLDAASLWLHHDGQDRMTKAFADALVAEVRALRAQVSPPGDPAAGREFWIYPAAKGKANEWECYNVRQVDDEDEPVEGGIRVVAALSAPSQGAREADELAYAQRIASYGVKKFVPDRKTWQPLDTMMGVLSQIDNLLAGTPAPVPAAPAAPVDAFKLVDTLVDAALRYYDEKTTGTAEPPALVALHAAKLAIYDAIVPNPGSASTGEA